MVNMFVFPHLIPPLLSFPILPLSYPYRFLTRSFMPMVITQLAFFLASFFRFPLILILTSNQWTYAQVQSFVSDFRAVIKDRKNHYYHEVRCVYGRKPTPEEEALRDEQQRQASESQSS